MFCWCSETVLHMVKTSCLNRIHVQHDAYSLYIAYYMYYYINNGNMVAFPEAGGLPRPGKL